MTNEAPVAAAHSIFDGLSLMTTSSLLSVIVGAVSMYCLSRVSVKDITALIVNLFSVWIGRGIPSQPAAKPPETSLSDEIPAHLIPGHELAFMRLLSTGMSIGFIFVDEGHLIKVFNPAAEEIFGYTAEEIIGADLSLLIPPDEATRHHFYVEQYREQRGLKKVSRAVGKTRPRMIKKANGQTETVMLSVTDVKNGISGFVGLVWRQEVHPVQTIVQEG